MCNTPSSLNKIIFIDENQIEFSDGHIIKVGKIVSVAIHGIDHYPRAIFQGYVENIDPESESVLLSDLTTQYRSYPIAKIIPPENLLSEKSKELNEKKLKTYLNDLFSIEIVVENDEFYMDSIYHNYDYHSEGHYSLFDSRENIIRKIMLENVDFDDIGNITELRLGGYGITDFPKPLYPLPLSELQSFSIEGYFQVFPKDLLINCTKLQRLSIISNLSLLLISEGFLHFPSLTHLILRSRGGIQFRGNLFSNLHELISITLDGPSMKDLKTIYKCSKLRYASFSLDRSFLNKLDIENIIELFSHVTHLYIYFHSMPFLKFRGSSLTQSDLYSERKTLLETLKKTHESKFEMLLLKFGGGYSSDNSYFHSYHKRLRILEQE